MNLIITLDQKTLDIFARMAKAQKRSRKNMIEKWIMDNFKPDSVQV